MRFSGRLDAPVMINMHYPPEIAALLLMATTDPKNPCLHLLMTKLGLASGHETDHIVWTERIYLQTSTELRSQNKARPYEVLYSPADLDRCSQLNRQISERATYGARLLVNKEVVLEEFARAKADSDWKFFTIPLPNGQIVPLYDQPYHGAVNVKTAQFHFGSFHTEYILRDHVSDRCLLLSRRHRCQCFRCAFWHHHRPAAWLFQLQEEQSHRPISLGVRL